MRRITLAVGLSAMGDWLAIAPLSLHLAEIGDSGFALAALFGAPPFRDSPAQFCA